MLSGDSYSPRSGVIVHMPTRPPSGMIAWRGRDLLWSGVIAAVRRRSWSARTAAYQCVWLARRVPDVSFGRAWTHVSTTTVWPFSPAEGCVPIRIWSITCRPYAALRHTQCGHADVAHDHPPDTAACWGSSTTAAGCTRDTCRSSAACSPPDASPTSALRRPWLEPRTGRPSPVAVRASVAVHDGPAKTATRARPIRAMLRKR